MSGHLIRDVGTALSMTVASSEETPELRAGTTTSQQGVFYPGPARAWWCGTAPLPTTPCWSPFWLQKALGSAARPPSSLLPACLPGPSCLASLVAPDLFSPGWALQPSLFRAVRASLPPGRCWSLGVGTCCRALCGCSALGQVWGSHTAGSPWRALHGRAAAVASSVPGWPCSHAG